MTTSFLFSLRIWKLNISLLRIIQKQYWGLFFSFLYSVFLWRVCEIMNNWTYIKLSKDQFIYLFDNFALTVFSFTHVEYFIHFSHICEANHIVNVAETLLRCWCLDSRSDGVFETFSQVFTNSVVFIFPR